MTCYAHRFAMVAAALFALLPSSLRADEGRLCENETEPELKLRLGEIENQLAKVWARRGPDWITAYDITGTPKNPFDVKGQGSGAAAEHGFAWLRDVPCRLADGKTAGTLNVTYTAAAYRFKEGRSKWVEPMSGGTIAEYVLSRNGPTWSIKDLSRDETIFLPESSMRMPRAGEMPPQKAWPDKRCAFPKSWQGKDCVPSSPKSSGAAIGNPDAH